MPRPIWTGAISFGLVSIPVQVVSAIGSEHAVKFHQMHRTDQGRVRQRKVCEIDEQELTQDDIVRGYTAPDGRVAIVRDEDLDDIPLPTAHTVEVAGFLPVAEVNPLRWSKPYYLKAAKGGAKPYVLMRDALRRSGKAAVAKVAMRGKESLVLLRVYEDVLVMQQLYWPDEVNPADRVAPDDRVTVTDSELDAAQALMDALGEADLDSMRDEYQHAVQEIVAAKLDERELPKAAPEEGGGAPVVDIMEALRASLADAEKRKAKPGRETKKSTAKKTTAKKTAAKKTPAKGGGRRAS